LQGHKPTVWIDLGEQTEIIERDDQLSWTINTVARNGKKRSYVFTAASTEEREQWLRATKDCS